MSRGTDQGLTRRRLLAAGAAAGAAAALPPGRGWAARRTPRARGGTFPHGVVCGQPGERTATLWTRLGGHERDALVELEVARDRGFGRVVHRATVRAARWRDHTAHHLVPSRALRPGEEYFYRFATRTTSSPVGRFRTRRPPDSREPVRIGWFSCQGWQPGYFNAHDGLAAEPDLDLAVCLGDYIYEKTDDTGPRTDPTGKDGDGFAQTLPEYRAKWRLYRSDASLQRMHAAHPFAMVWDNHELASDDPGHLDGAAIRVPLALRKTSGRLTFFENVPMPRFRRAHHRIHRSLTLGRHLELLLLDNHTYEDRAAGTLLGPTQRGWLMDRLARSPATWKLIGSQVMMMALDLPEGQPLNRGQWDGYPEERRTIMQYVVDRQIKGVSVIAGDIHTFFAGQVTTTGRRDGTPAATEFIGGAITSEPGPEMFVGDDLAPTVGVAFERAPLFNPHLAFNDHVRNGYGVLEARPDELRVEFKAVRTKRRPDPTVERLAAFRVPHGEPRVERVA